MRVGHSQRECPTPSELFYVNHIHLIAIGEGES